MSDDPDPGTETVSSMNGSRGAGYIAELQRQRKAERIASAKFLLTGQRQCAWGDCQAGGVILEEPAPMVVNEHGRFHPGCDAARQYAAAARRYSAEQ